MKHDDFRLPRGLVYPHFPAVLAVTPVILCLPALRLLLNELSWRRHLADRLAHFNLFTQDSESAIIPGVEIDHRAIIGSRSLVLCGTIIKPYELWAGIPVRKIKDLTPDRVQE